MRALDGLRILAALMVCAYHYAGKAGPVAQSWGQSPAHVFPTFSQAATYGSLGVQFFFLISGFVICMSSWGRSVGGFFRSRVSRLYPAYWVAIVLVTAAACALPVVVEPLRSDQLLLNLTMLQQPMGADRVLGVCWTLWVELRFYVLFALFVVWRGVTYRRVVIFCCLWTFAGVLARVAATPLTDELVMRDHAPYFIGGLALYLIHRYGSNLLL
jgi:peptidoglycan/LPS O-acetylase OafA/YrhL